MIQLPEGLTLNLPCVCPHALYFSPNKYFACFTTFNVYSGGGLVAKSCPTLGTQWTAACQAPLAMGFSRREYWSGVPLPSPGLAVILIAIPPVIVRVAEHLSSGWSDLGFCLFFFFINGCEQNLPVPIGLLKVGCFWNLFLQNLLGRCLGGYTLRNKASAGIPNQGPGHLVTLLCILDARGSGHHRWGALKILVSARKKTDSTGLRGNPTKGTLLGLLDPTTG